MGGQGRTAYAKLYQGGLVFYGAFEKTKPEL